MEHSKSLLAKRYHISPFSKQKKSPLVFPLITKPYVSNSRSNSNIKQSTCILDLENSEKQSQVTHKIKPIYSKSRMHLKSISSTLYITDYCKELKKQLKNSSVVGKPIEPQAIIVKEKPVYKSSSLIVPSKPKGKSKDQTQTFTDFLHRMRLSNAVNLDESATRMYKFYVGPGNNSGLIVRTLRKRYWWVCCDSPKQAHFVWTSLKNKRVFRTLPNGNSIPKRAITVSSNSIECPLKHSLILKSPLFKTLEPAKLNNNNIKLCNKLPGNKQLCSKKYLYFNLKAYFGDSLFSVIPLTFHVSKTEKNSEFAEFESAFLRRKAENLNNTWIVKPGEGSNRGRGISICESLADIKRLLSYSSYQSIIIQKYIHRPLLINKRKFDIRCYGLLTSVRGNIQGYFYQDGYIRTSSYEYSLESRSRYIHLTNDAIQKYSEMYGKFENANKLSYADLQDYLNYNFKGVNFYDQILPQIREIVKDSFCATYKKIDTKRKQHCFELFGYDFMIDENLKVWLIEINTNPCLEECCGLLVNLLNSLIDNTFNVAVDPLFPPDEQSKKFSNWVKEKVRENKYELVFSE